MIADIKKHVQSTPFRPFTIRMTDGREYSVQTIDHIFFPPSGGRVVVEDDDGSIIALPALHMSGLAEAPDSKHKPRRSR
jgi:hypothetical protein